MITSLRPVQAYAVGYGIIAALDAAAETPARNETEALWLHLCITAADEAHAEVMRHPPIVRRTRSVIDDLIEDLDGGDPAPEPETLDGEALDAAARAAAAAAFLGCMPPLTARRRIRGYIACVAVAMQRRYVSAVDASKLLYAAQTALLANPKPAPRKGRKAKRA